MGVIITKNTTIITKNTITTSERCAVTKLNRLSASLQIRRRTNRSHRQHHGHTLGDNVRRVALVDVARWFEAIWDEAARWLEAVSHGFRSFVFSIPSVSYDKQKQK